MVSTVDPLLYLQEHLNQDYKMADTTFIDQVTVISTDWLNDLNRLHYTLLADPTTTQEIIDALPVVTPSTAGTSSAADKTKLDGIETAATADQTAAEIRTLVDSATDSNVFTDADHSKLDGIEASADVTDATNVTAAGALMDSELADLAGVKGVTISTLQVKPSEGAFVNGDKTRLDALSPATGSKVFSSVASSATAEDATIAPGLSTNDMDFGFTVLGATNQEVNVGLRNLDGYSLTMNEGIGGFSENAHVASMTAPGANLLTIKVYNSHTSAQNITVRWWARKR